MEKPRENTALIPRRAWLCRMGMAGLGLGTAGLGSGLLGAARAEDALPYPSGDEEDTCPPRISGVFFPKEASWYEKLGRGLVRCGLCPHRCEVEPGSRGNCGVRLNKGGTLYTLVWGNPCVWHADPVEKKPLNHFKPGTLAFSLATAGCNFTCKHCQNWHISQAKPEDLTNKRLPPEKLVELAKTTRSASIAFTYGEPVVFSEFVRDTSILARARGVETLMISNGFIEPGPMKELCKHLSAVKIDLKGFTERFYREICGGKLAPVMRTLELLAKLDVWFEIVTLVIPTQNDSEEEIRRLSRWVLKSLGKDVPVHFTRFHPTYKLRNLPWTPIRTLDRLRAVALSEGLRYVYLGNVPGHEGENTYCPGCGSVVVRRIGFAIAERGYAVKGGKAFCRACGTEIAGRF